jgi:hypothetical protein
MSEKIVIKKSDLKKYSKFMLIAVFIVFGFFIFLGVCRRLFASFF